MHSSNFSCFFLSVILWEILILQKNFLCERQQHTYTYFIRNEHRTKKLGYKRKVGKGSGKLADNQTWLEFFNTLGEIFRAITIIFKKWRKLEFLEFSKRKWRFSVGIFLFCKVWKGFVLFSQLETAIVSRDVR